MSRTAYCDASAGSRNSIERDRLILRWSQRNARDIEPGSFSQQRGGTTLRTVGEVDCRTFS